MEKLSPANQALIAKMQNNQVQTQAQSAKAPELPNDTVKLSTSVKKPKNKAGALIAGIIAGATIATGLIVAYKKGVFFKLEGAMLKKEADKAYQKAQVVVEEVTELINKGLNENLEEFTDEKTGRTVKIFADKIEEYNGDSLAREAWFDLIDDKINLTSIIIGKKGKGNTAIFLSENKIGSLQTTNSDGTPIKASRVFDYSKNMHYKNANIEDKTYKCFLYNSDSKLIGYTKKTETQTKTWSQENGFKREKIQKPNAEFNPEEAPVEEISVEEDFPEVVIAEEEPIIDDFDMLAFEEDYAE